MKKADLEKLKGKKLEGQRSRGRTADRFGGAGRAAKEKHQGALAGESLIGQLLKQALEKK